MVESRSNIYVHGPNGSGKSVFVQDMLGTLKQESLAIFIDCIEFYSEKLIAIYLSQELDIHLKNKAKLFKLNKDL
jgi:ABC-type Mn2+/Zn2+ transport system ATPase subunit